MVHTSNIMLQIRPNMLRNLCLPPLTQHPTKPLICVPADIREIFHYGVIFIKQDCVVSHCGVLSGVLIIFILILGSVVSFFYSCCKICILEISWLCRSDGTHIALSSEMKADIVARAISFSQTKTTVVTPSFSDHVPISVDRLVGYASSVAEHKSPMKSPLPQTHSSRPKPLAGLENSSSTTASALPNGIVTVVGSVTRLSTESLRPVILRSPVAVSSSSTTPSRRPGHTATSTSQQRNLGLALISPGEEPHRHLTEAEAQQRAQAAAERVYPLLHLVRMSVIYNSYIHCNVFVLIHLVRC